MPGLYKLGQTVQKEEMNPVHQGDVTATEWCQEKNIIFFWQSQYCLATTFIR
jgi:hypothetical protein